MGSYRKRTDPEPIQLRSSHRIDLTWDASASGVTFDRSDLSIPMRKDTMRPLRPHVARVVSALTVEKPVTAGASVGEGLGDRVEVAGLGRIVLGGADAVEDALDDVSGDTLGDGIATGSSARCSLVHAVAISADTRSKRR